jgi:hypothetical protein
MSQQSSQQTYTHTSSREIQTSQKSDLGKHHTSTLHTEITTTHMDAFTIRVQTLAPATHEVSVVPSTTVAALKQTVSTLAGVPAHRQRLIWRGRVIQDAQTLEQLGEALKGMVHGYTDRKVRVRARAAGCFVWSAAGTRFALFCP